MTIQPTTGEIFDIARVYWPAKGRDEEFRDNARLIAAAPDLLEVCKQVHELLSGTCIDSDLLDCRKLLAEAIAKAEPK